MEASLILLCKYHGETCGIRVFQSSTFGQLMDKLSSRWSCLKSTAVRLCYSFSGDPFCLLENDDDLEVMLDLVLRSGGHQVHVSLLDGGSSSSRGSTSIDTSSTGSELAVCRRELKLQEDKEVDLLTSFCPNKETVLLSAGWRDLINKVGQKFLGGVVEFREALSILAAYAPTKKAFYEIIAKLKSHGINRVDDLLSNLPNEHWAHAFFPGKRYGEMWSNLAESFNSWIKEERHLPITQLVDRIRVKIMEQMSSRLEAAGKWNYVVCPKMNAALNQSFQECKSWTVRRSAVNVFEVQCDPSVSVNIARRTCSCCQWQFKGFPCCHAVCAIYHSKKELNSFIDPYFYVTTYRDAYSKSIYPIPTLWKPAPGGKEDSILPPLSKKPPGRPRKKRIRSNGEKTRPIKCSRCGKIGRHNKKSCKEDLRIAGS
ncbi:hypothetical protein Vadar_004199 [Vaccinium darrowii]|uniref:Uncharacterized protein n=1 Tax=Vaccinium darrowii TaxID=229202 RepID=A0ACB7WXS2_9ERIC|nr:hypothetical protein Vadar_004199 [Vaccinium darrowii]